MMNLRRCLTLDEALDCMNLTRSVLNGPSSPVCGPQVTYRFLGSTSVEGMFIARVYREVADRQCEQVDVCGYVVEGNDVVVAYLTWENGYLCEDREELYPRRPINLTESSAVVMQGPHTARQGPRFDPPQQSARPDPQAPEESPPSPASSVGYDSDGSDFEWPKQEETGVDYAKLVGVAGVYPKTGIR
ncbi:hypothetical protein CYMTET_35594 [Cymbomonas tetramitiformis]|uniref:Uncharacterized protein n=1 Tax=Cymbomonas tetramitiformis TaxID=36881 RepID=A0AAE0KNH6_9CHLO|nr:hypothetical protein CYMTET_35594 [Cymbomonas tetramitiformis]